MSQVPQATAKFAFSEEDFADKLFSEVLRTEPNVQDMLPKYTVVVMYPWLDGMRPKLQHIRYWTPETEQVLNTAVFALWSFETLTEAQAVAKFLTPGAALYHQGRRIS